MIQYSQINRVHHIKKMKDKKHKIISVDAEKGFEIKNPFLIKTQQSSYREDTHIINIIYDTLTTNIIPNGEKLNKFS